MNFLTGRITAIRSSSSMSMVNIVVGNDTFSVIVIDTPKTAAYLKSGQPVKLLFKETEVMLGKNISGNFSVTNRFKATVKTVRQDILLTQVELDYQSKSIVALINTDSLALLNLKMGDVIDWLIESNEISLAIEPEKS